MLILQSFMLLLVFQLLGEIVSRFAHLPIPGPVLGMAFLAAWYVLRKKDPEKHVEATADGLLGWLGLLFVPAGVGIVANLQLLRSGWLSVLVALIGSTVATLVITAAVMNRMTKKAS